MNQYRRNQGWQHKKDNLPTLPDDIHSVLLLEDVHHDGILSRMQWYLLGRLGSQVLIDSFLLVLQCAFKLRVAEPVPRGKQFGRLGAPTGQDELLTHFAHHQAHNEIRHDATWLHSEGSSCGR